METKLCPHCGKEYPVTEFYRNKSKPDGYSSYCKTCTKDAIKMYRDGKSDKTKVASTPKVEIVEKTLSDFSPRDIIRHLYNLGYRIENNSLVCYTKQIVNIKDVING